jgi:hypothetical protein
MSLVAPPASGDPASATQIDIDDAECDGAFAPEATSVYPFQDDSEITLEVLILLDEVSLSKGQATAEFMAKPYAEVGIKLVPFFEEVVFPDDGVDANGMPTIDSEHLLQLSKEHTGGIRPHGIDAVYTMTSKEIVGSLGAAVAGQADCVGGVVSAAEAFAVGESGNDESPGWNHWSGRVAAHEVAHLLGAHHHYANCAQADPSEAAAHLFICTLMFNDVLFISLRMSTVESAAVRGYALAYANATPTGPPPLKERTLEMKFTKVGIRGKLNSDLRECAMLMDVALERFKRGSWVVVGEAATDQNGEFDLKLALKPGRYRTNVKEVNTHDDEGWFTCSSASSPESTRP